MTSYCVRPEGRIAYDVTGAGPLIIAVPGMGELRSSSAPLATALSAHGFRVATMDLRGHGDSDATFTAYDDEALAGDIRALATELGGPAVVIGSSMGAAGAVIAAAAEPELFRALILAGPFVRDPKISPLARRWQRLLFRVLLVKPWGPRAWTSYHRTLFPSAPPTGLAAHQAAIRASLARPAYWRAFQQTTRTSHAPAEQRLGDVSCPVLVVMGTADPDWADPTGEARWVADALSAEVLLVPEAGHYPLVERPDLTVPPVVALLRRATSVA